MPTKWKKYQGQIFNRSEQRFRGVHQGFSIMEDHEQTARFMMNFGTETLGLQPREGSRRRNQVDAEIHNVELLPTAKMLAVGTSVFAAPPNELWDNRYRYSQFEHLAYDPTTWSELTDVEWQDRIPSNTF